MSRERMTVAFITWERHRRTREIAKAFDARLIEVLPSVHGWWRYLGLAARTSAALASTRPTHLLVQCPSIVLALLTVLLRPLFGYVLVLDLHNESVEPYVNKSGLYARVLRFLHRSADFCLVTTLPLCDVVRAHGGIPFVLPDRVPDMTPAESVAREASPAQVVFVCSYAPDEPVLEVIEAARMLDEQAVIHVTGRAPAAIRELSLPPNVRLTGFLAESDYEQLLRNASAIVDLTDMENCLVCGAYEAVALGKPLITSNTAALRSYFRRGTVYTRHDAGSIARAVWQALSNANALSTEMQRLRSDLDLEWQSSFRQLADRLRGPELLNSN